MVDNRKRAGTADRERTAEWLLRAMSNGYLSPTDYSDRAALAASATHIVQLTSLTDDLPRSLMVDKRRRRRIAIGASAAAAVLVCAMTAFYLLRQPVASDNQSRGNILGATAKRPAQTAPANGDDTASLLSVGFGQKDRAVAVWSEVENHTGNDGAFVVVNFNLYDASGALIKTASQTERFGFGLEKMYVGTHAYLDTAIPIAKIEATVTANSYNGSTKPDYDFGLTIGAVTFVDASSPKATVEITNPSDVTVSSARVSVACFDASGNIIGGGYAFPNAIAPEQRVLAEASVTTSGHPAKCMATAVPAKY